MWAFMSNGFISIVESKQNPDYLVVRARSQKHLDDFRNGYCPEMTPVEVDTGTDYPYRAYASRSAVADAMHLYVTLLNYKNFKSSVKDDGYHAVLMKIWLVMSEYGWRLRFKSKVKQPPPLPLFGNLARDEEYGAGKPKEDVKDGQVIRRDSKRFKRRPKKD